MRHLCTPFGSLMGLGACLECWVENGGRWQWTHEPPQLCGASLANPFSFWNLIQLVIQSIHAWVHDLSCYRLQCACSHITLHFWGAQHCGGVRCRGRCKKTTLLAVRWIAGIRKQTCTHKLWKHIQSSCYQVNTRCGSKIQAKNKKPLCTQVCFVCQLLASYYTSHF